MNPINGLKTLVYRVGYAIRESGQALERVGCRLQGNHSYAEQLNRHMPVMPMRYATPTLGQDAFVAPSGLVVGNVSLGDKSSVWYNAIIRGDFQPVTIGNNTNIQDSVYVGATSEHSPAVEIGDNVSVGHGAVLKGCTIGKNVLIGINSVVSEGCEVQKDSVVAAGAYLEEGTVVPSGELWAGSPAKKLRDLKPAEVEYIRNLPTRYTEMASEHSDVMSLLRFKQEEYSR